MRVIFFEPMTLPSVESQTAREDSMTNRDTPRGRDSRPGWRDDDPLIPNTEWDAGPEDNPYRDDTPGDGPRDLRD